MKLEDGGLAWIARIICIVSMFLAGIAQAETRIALVIGNSNYSTVTALDNPSSDATLMAQTLEKLGFKVTTLIDAGQADMMMGIAAFGRSLREAGSDATGLFYYAGHGVQSFGNNYLLPVDIQLQDAADLDLVALEAQSVLRQMFSARNKTNIVILDACRNNPFSKIPEFNESGLAELKAPTGTFLAYATEPGSVAMDGLDGNSPFTEALARHITQPGVPIEQVFKQVRIDVLRETGNRQTPWDTSSLTTNFQFIPEKPMTAEELAERQFWESVEVTKDPVQLMLFLRAYPDSAYAEDARALLNEAMQQELSSNAPPAAAVVNEGPSMSESSAFEAAQAAGTIESYEEFLKMFPDGTFAEFVQGEIDSLRANAATDPQGGGVTAPAEQVAAAPAPAAPEPTGPVTFEAPLAAGDDAIRGKTLAELIRSSPMFPPFDGLPDEVWKGKKCTDCHQWERANLCTQAQTYLATNFERALNKKHPFGGTFKRNLRDWAANDCR